MIPTDIVSPHERLIDTLRYQKMKAFETWIVVQGTVGRAIACEVMPTASSKLKQVQHMFECLDPSIHSR